MKIITLGIVAFPDHLILTAETPEENQVLNAVFEWETQEGYGDVICLSNTEPEAILIERSRWEEWKEDNQKEEY